MNPTEWKTAVDEAFREIEHDFIILQGKLTILRKACSHAHGMIYRNHGTDPGWNAVLSDLVNALVASEEKR